MYGDSGDDELYGGESMTSSMADRAWIFSWVERLRTGSGGSEPDRFLFINGSCLRPIVPRPTPI